MCGFPVISFISKGDNFLFTTNVAQKTILSKCPPQGQLHWCGNCESHRVQCFEGPMSGLMPCYHYSEILWTRSPHFHFALGDTNYTPLGPGSYWQVISWRATENLSTVAKLLISSSKLVSSPEETNRVLTKQFPLLTLPLQDLLKIFFSLSPLSYLLIFEWFPLCAPSLPSPAFLLTSVSQRLSKSQWLKSLRSLWGQNCFLHSIKI